MSTAQLELLDTERRGLLAAVEQVAVADRSRRPAFDKWSVAEILEHLATVEQSVAKLIATRGREPLPENAEAPVPLDEARVARLRGRGRRIEVPDRMRPSGTMTAAAAIEALGASRTALLDAVKNADPVALAQRSYVHAIVGRIVLCDWIAFVAHHEARHADQIREIATALSGPEP
jgi:DinB family protein